MYIDKKKTGLGLYYNILTAVNFFFFFFANN